MVLGLPIFDTIFAIVRRIKNGKSLKAVFKPDKGHLHHRLIRKGYTQKQAVIILYVVTAALGMFAIIFVYDGIIKALAFMFVVIVMLWIGRSELSKFNDELLKENENEDDKKE